MAGLGTKLFTAFSKLTAAQVNGYLMDQSIMRFASTAARDAAFGGAGEPTLAEGMTCYLDDLNVLQSYTGSAWVTIASSANPSGLELITSCTVTSTGGTSATASGGIITIGSANTSVTVANAFSANHDNYRIIYSGGTLSAQERFKMTLGASVASYYSAVTFVTYLTGNFGSAGSHNSAAWAFIAGGYTNSGGFTMDLQNPFLAKYTQMNAFGSLEVEQSTNVQGIHASAVSYSSFILSPASGTFTGGTLRVYGYRNS